MILIFKFELTIPIIFLPLVKNAQNTQHKHTGGGFEDDDDADSHVSRDSRSLDTMDEAPNLANNVRIKSRRFLRDYEVEDEVGKCAFFTLENIQKFPQI